MITNSFIRTLYIVTIKFVSFQPVRNLVTFLETNNVTVATQEVFLQDPSTQIKNLKVSNKFVQKY